jgi:hypothetical protein
VPLYEQGRAWLEPVKLWLSVIVYSKTGGDRLALVDPLTNQEIPDYGAISQSLVVETNARAQAEQRALAAEQRLRELEAKLKRRGRGKSS